MYTHHMQRCRRRESGMFLDWVEYSIIVYYCIQCFKKKIVYNEILLNNFSIKYVLFHIYKKSYLFYISKCIQK